MFFCSIVVSSLSVVFLSCMLIYGLYSQYTCVCVYVCMHMHAHLE